jgi:uncharacterized cofD-like protein
MQRKKIVTISGGTGSFTLLSGLKKYPIDISAIVSMADDGGSTGVLRDELGVLPPGDARQCLVALSDSTDELRALMNYRFDQGGLAGHNFGNLFLSALEKINNSFSKGVAEAAKILDVQGEVIPVSEKNMRLHIKLKNGEVLLGESQLDHNDKIRKIGLDEIFLKPKIGANKKALEKIMTADAIFIGPGDLYGSILPNILVGGIAEAIKKTKAKIFLNCNLTNKKGQTDDYKISDYVRVIESLIGKNKINFVIFNSEKIPKKLIEKYEKREGVGSVIVFDIVSNEKRNYKIILADILRKEEIKFLKEDIIASSRSFIRHDSDKLAKVLMMLLEIGDYNSIIKEII